MKQKELKEITQITVKGKIYYLCDDGNLYEKDEKENYIMLDNINEESKELIRKIMEKLKPMQTDVIIEGKEKKINKKKIEVELPEF